MGIFYKPFLLNNQDSMESIRGFFSWLTWRVMSCFFLKLMEYTPRPSKGIKFQPPGLFLVIKGYKFHTVGGFRQVTSVQNHPVRYPAKRGLSHYCHLQIPGWIHRWRCVLPGVVTFIPHCSQG